MAVVLPAAASAVVGYGVNKALGGGGGGSGTAAAPAYIDPDLVRTQMMDGTSQSMGRLDE